MKFATSAAPFAPPDHDIAWVMRQVLYAVVPAILAHWWFFGWGIVIQILIALPLALGFEALALRLRGRTLRPFISDYTVVVTAVLFALCAPPLLPWWITAVAMFFAVVVAKHLYGGLGYNLFNPAMVGFVVAIIAFPREMTMWLLPTPLAEYTPGFWESLRTVLTNTAPGGLTWDAITHATPLDIIRTETARDIMVSEIRANPVFGDFGGRGWEWIANWYVLGGFYLLYQRIISWHVPVAMIGTVILFSLPFYLVDPGANPFPLQHIFSGALVFGAFFLATDPVSGCATPRGRLIFGIGIGLLVLAIRRWGAYPDGVAFAILIMNMVAPLIDQHTIPRAFGHLPKEEEP